MRFPGRMFDVGTRRNVRDDPLLPEAGGARYAADAGGKSHSKFLEKVPTFQVELFFLPVV